MTRRAPLPRPMRSVSSRPPTRPPPMKAMADSATVQRSASSRLRTMSQRVNSTMANAPEQEARAVPHQQPARDDGQLEVGQRRDDEGLEGSEVAALDEVGR